MPVHLHALVVHSCLELGAAETELPALCAGDLSTLPSSGQGSNAAKPESERRLPRVVFFGKFIGDEEYEHVTRLIVERAGPGKVQFLRVTNADVLAVGGSGPDPDVIAKIYRNKIAALQGHPSGDSK
jgi:hypothetical protein